MATPKDKAKWAAAIAAFFATVSQINSIAPALQDKFVQSLQAIFPVSWRPEIVAICGFISAASAIYALVNASHSGPSAPPPNDPVTGKPLDK